MYVDIGASCTDTATLQFTFTGTSTTRLFEIKVTQIPCNSDYSPRDGCLQYHTGFTGRITTFNLIPTDESHLQDQDYSVCIRREVGFCCVQYQLCTDENSMTLGTINTAAQTDTLCTEDYFAIPGSAGACNGNNAAVTNQYCGTNLNVLIGAGADIPICDCTAPFMVEIETDNNIGDTNVAIAIAQVTQSKGVCLEWTQIPCGTGTP